MEDKRIRLRENDMEYKKGFKWHTLPYEAIKQAYLRIEEVNGRLCCGVANFDMFFLMLRTTDEKLVKIETSSKDVVKQMLEELKMKNDKIEIGYKKEIAEPLWYGKREVSLENEKSQVRVAVEAMLEEAEKVADGKAEYATYEEVFGVEGKD